MKNNLLIIGVILIVLLSSSFSPNMRNTWFYHFNKVEDSSIVGNYIEKKDGNKIHSNQVIKNEQTLFSGSFIVGDQKIKASEVKAMMNNGHYFTTYKNDLVQRIVRGKINIYFSLFPESRNGPYGEPYRYYSQNGEQGELKMLNNYSELLDLVAACPISSNMIANKSKKELKGELENDHQYFNRVIDIYNNGCKREKIIY